MIQFDELCPRAVVGCWNLKLNPLMADKPPGKNVKHQTRGFYLIICRDKRHVQFLKVWTVGSVKSWSWFWFSLTSSDCWLMKAEIKSTNGCQATREICKVNHQTHDRCQTTFRDKFHLQFLRVDHRFSWELVMIQFYVANNWPKRKYLHASLCNEKLLQQTSYMSHC